MPDINGILKISSGAEFEKTALELFRFQSATCLPYRRFITALGIRPEEIDAVHKIPFLPVGAFKTQQVYCGEEPAEMIFTSSTTTGSVPSRHFMAHLSIYEKTFTTAFEMFYGELTDYSFYALLPGYLEREGSSLIYMADNMIKRSGGGFYLNQYGQLREDMAINPRKKILLGVSYALLDMAEQFPGKLDNTIVMETGGMKGRRKEMTKEDLHQRLRTAFGVETVHSEYGMAELTSQAYSTGNGVYSCPPWMRVLIRDVNDPFDIKTTPSMGGVNIIDLANIYSCAFIQTQDVATTLPGGDFILRGRADHSEIRGCNLLVE